MAKQVLYAQQPNHTSRHAVKVVINDRFTYALVASDAIVEYKAFYHSWLERSILCVYANDEFIGWHCGERSNTVVCFKRHSDAKRLADVRNASWLASRRSVKEVA